jgi:molybdopterin-guanine dinucleotide biosynthesis protein B
MMKKLEKKTVPPVVSIVGNSGSGKTTFLEKLIPVLTGRGLKVGSIKHDVHGFELDKPGKDSWRHKHAGASTTVISSPYQIGMVKDVEYDHQPDELFPLFNGMDIILTEGYKRSNMPKLEIFRLEITTEPLCKNDEKLLALISDSAIDIGVPVFSTGDIQKVADFLIQNFNLIPFTKRKNRKVI